MPSDPRLRIAALESSVSNMESLLIEEKTKNAQLEAELEATRQQSKDTIDALQARLRELLGE